MVLQNKMNASLNKIVLTTYINHINISTGILSLENIYGMLLPSNQGLNFSWTLTFVRDKWIFGMGK